MKFIIGKKQDMTQVWQDGKVVAVTRVQAGPCTVVQVKNNEKDGYQAVQLGFGQRKEKNIKKPQKGHMKKLGNFSALREFKIETKELKTGDQIDINTFNPGDTIQVVSISKGRGFQGVVKRHHFSGSKKTHGNKDQLRMSGSVAPKGPAHIFKGTRMGGHMGDDRVTVKNLEIIEINAAENILLIKGAVPGYRNSLVLISGEGELKLKTEKSEKPAEIIPAEENIENSKEVSVETEDKKAE